MKAKKAFTLSFATPETMEIADYFGVESGRNVNKIEHAGVHVVKSMHVDAPVIEEFSLTLECEVVDIKDFEGEFQVVGKCVNMLADERILNEKGQIDLGKLKPISFDSATNTYRVLGDVVGHAFKDGLKLKK